MRWLPASAAVAQTPVSMSMNCRSAEKGSANTFALPPQDSLSQAMYDDEKSDKELKLSPRLTKLAVAGDETELRLWFRSLTGDLSVRVLNLI